MTDETSASDQHRLYVAHVTIEFDFAFLASPEEAGEAAYRLINKAAGDLSSLRDYAEVRAGIAAPAYEMPVGACEEDTVYDLRTTTGWGVEWRDAVENDKLLHAAAGALPASELPAAERFSVSQPDCLSCGATPEEPHGSECGDVDDEAGVEPALKAPSDVVRLDYSVPPPGYTADGQWWSHPAPPKARHVREIGPPTTHNIAMVANDGGLAVAWAHHKAHNDPPGMEVWQTNGSIVQAVWVFSVVGATIGIDWFTEMTEAQVAAWAWHDRRLALAARVSREVAVVTETTYRGHNVSLPSTRSPVEVWPRILTWTDEEVATVEHWLVDSTAEMPEVLRGS